MSELSGMLTEAEWAGLRAREEKGEHLPCPGCRTSGSDPRSFHTKVASRLGGDRHYVACKRCGYWQDVGEPAVRAWMSQHECERASVVGGPAFHCEHCNQDLQPGADGVIRHGCGKYLLPKDNDYLCKTCGRKFGRESQAPWELEWTE